jgi:hypothetical protein
MAAFLVAAAKAVRLTLGPWRRQWGRDVPTSEDDYGEAAGAVPPDQQDSS